MAITKDSDRQSPVVARIVTAAADISATGTYPAIDVPAGAVVVGGFARVIKAFNSSVTLTIGDEDDTDRYMTAAGTGAFPAANQLGEQTAGSIMFLALTGYEYPSNDTIDVVLGGAANTTGELEIVVIYVVAGRAEFSQG